MTDWRQANCSLNWKVQRTRVGYKRVDASAVTAANSRTLSTSRRQLSGHVPVDPVNCTAPAPTARMSRRCKRLSNCSPGFDSQFWLAEVIATSHAILCVWSKAGRSGDPLWGWFSLAQAASWHSLAFRSFSTRYTLALPIPSLVAISEGLAPSSLSRMISRQPCAGRSAHGPYSGPHAWLWRCPPSGVRAWPPARPVPRHR